MNLGETKTLSIIGTMVKKKNTAVLEALVTHIHRSYSKENQLNKHLNSQSVPQIRFLKVHHLEDINSVSILSKIPMDYTF